MQVKGGRDDVRIGSSKSEWEHDLDLMVATGSSDEKLREHLLAAPPGERTADYLAGWLAARSSGRRGYFVPFSGIVKIGSDGAQTEVAAGDVQ